ncbi:hypothetical protein B7486_60850, partial [cyanobacterium TDX16]
MRHPGTRRSSNALARLAALVAAVLLAAACGAGGGDDGRDGGEGAAEAPDDSVGDAREIRLVGEYGGGADHLR